MHPLEQTLDMYHIHVLLAPSPKIKDKASLRITSKNQIILLLIHVQVLPPGMFPSTLVLQQI